MYFTKNIISCERERNMNNYIDEEISLDDISFDSKEEEKTDDRVAIIGMSVITSAGDADAFWEDLKNGGSLVSQFRKKRMEDIKAYNAALGREFSYADGAFIKEIDKFDYDFFHMTPKEAELTDPCFRMFLQNTVNAIEDAGCGNNRLDDTDTRIYVGYAGNIKDSYINMIWNINEKDVSMSIVNNMTGMISGRLSHLLNTHGTAQIIDATCASSLIAVHEGCESILSGKCSLAIVGSMRINLYPVESEISRIGVESKDYQTRTFDEKASGFGEGDGVVTLILKSYQKAVKDKDSIHAVIKASSVSQGGKSMGLTVTNPSALKDTISDVIMKAEQNIDKIGMYELHGTATNLGDPIEMQGMTDAFRRFTDNRAFCAIGSVKSNMGHLYEASGIMGLVKTILALKHKVIPPTINLTEPNKEINFVDSPFYINSKAREWRCEEGKRCALVNSLGLNGANCCVLVEEYEEEHEAEKPMKQRFLALSAKSQSALYRLAESYISFLKNNDVNVDDLCYSAAVGRWHFDKRLLVEFETKDGLIRLLTDYCTGQNDQTILSETRSSANDERYEKLKKAYVVGMDVDWSDYFAEPYRMIHLPVYSFELNRCWIDYGNVSTNAAKQEAHLFDIVWKPTAIPSDSEDVQEVAVIGFSRDSVREYESYYQNKNVRTVPFCIDFEKPVCSVPFQNILITAEHFCAESQDAEIIKRLILFITQLCRNPEIETITLITDPVHLIDGTETINKTASVLTALLGAIQKEKPSLNCNILETDGTVSGTAFLDKMMKKEQFHFAYRNGVYYAPVIDEKVVEAKKQSFISGTYLITAATSLVTQAICTRLAKHLSNATFIFLSRSLSNYDSEQNGDKKPDSRIAECCREITDQNGRVIIRKTDICSAEKIVELLNYLNNENLIPDYLIHSASGDLSYEFGDTDIDKLSTVLDPKIKALSVIEDAFGSNLKGYILFSSMATAFMAPMQSSYIASNAYINAFCDEKCQNGKTAVALQWSTWKEIGMAARKGLNHDLIFHAMPTERALFYFDDIIKNGINGNVIIGTFNLSPMGRKLIENAKVKFAEGVILPERSIIKAEKADTQPELKGRSNENYTETERSISAICREILGYQSINIYDNFFEMGADSLQIMNLHKQLDKKYPGRLQITDMFSYSNVSKLAEYLCEENIGEDHQDTVAAPVSVDDHSLDDIAIIGIAAKIPGTESLKEFYESLLRGECFVRELPAWRKEFLTKYYQYSKQPLQDEPFTDSAYLDHIDEFDYEYFHISPREASLMDPHQRLYLELAVEAMEDAGYSTEKMKKSKTGVFLGFGTNIKDMYMRMLADVSSEDIADAIVGNTQCVLAGRISHDLDLKGASMVIDTACSSSIVALNTAIQYIKTGQITAALVGGIKLLLCPVRNDELYTIGMESADGFTRTFDQTATGTAFGESAQMILIKPYGNAVRDGDHIYGVIKATAINQDGESAGVTAPNPISQQDVILEAWNKAGIDPTDLGFVEVHGTATRLGDTIEYKSLNKAFKKFTDKNGICAVSTVKPNFGHMSEGAGLFSLIKGLMILKYDVIPKNILFDLPNRSIDMTDSAIYYNTRNIRWERSDKKRTFALSNFGMSGTNTHTVIQEATVQSSRVITRKRRIVVLSNRIESGLASAAKNLYRFIIENDINFHDLCYTLAVGRNHYSLRLAFICENIDQLRDKLRQYVEGKTLAKDVYYGCKKVVSKDRVYLNADEMYAEEQNLLTEKAKAVNEIETLASLYCQGADLNFERQYEGEVLFRVSLPTYSFTKKHCWIQIPEIFQIDEQLYYSLEWKEQNLRGNESGGGERKRFIVIADQNAQRHLEILEALRLKGVSCSVYGIQEILTQYCTAEKMQALLNVESQRSLDGIIQFMPDHDNVYNNDNFALLLNLFRTAKAIIQNNLMSELKMITLSFCAYQVDSTEKAYQPLGAISHGMNRVIGLELSNVSSYAIDADTETESSLIADEICLADKNNYYVSFRKNRRYVQEIVSLTIPSSSGKYQVKSDGVYVITGGTGGIGLFYAKCLAEENKNTKIVLIARSNRYANDPEAMEKIRKLRSICASLEIYEADVSDAEKTAAVFENIKAKYNRINGVIHAAGNASAQIIALRNEDDILNVIRPKYDGTWNVFLQLVDENVDFFILCSSGCTLTGETSQADYVAANSYLDVFTYYANQHNVKTHCINFSSWKSEGMSVRYKINVDAFFKALDNIDAKKALFEIINSGCERCFVGKINAEYCREQAIDLKTLPFDVSAEIEKELKIKGEVSAIDFVPLRTKQSIGSTLTELKGNDENTLSYTETEKVIASMVGKVLGLNTINIYDSFFELGGDSILLGRLHALIEQQYPSRLKLLDLFEYNSVKKIAEYLSDSGTINEPESATAVDEKAESNHIDDLVERFERGEISIDDVLSEIT